MKFEGNMCLLHEGWRKTEDLIKQMSSVFLQPSWSKHMFDEFLCLVKFRKICEILKRFAKFVKFGGRQRSSSNMCLLHEGWRKTEDPIKQMLIKQELIKHVFTP